MVRDLMHLACLDVVLGGDGLALAGELAVLVPLAPHLPAAAHVGDGEDHPAVELGEARDREAGLDRVLVRAVAVQVDGARGGARLAESITNPDNQIEARLPRDQAEALARAATDYGSIGEAFAAEDGAAAQQVQAYFRSGGGYDALADSIQAVTQNKEAYPKSVRKAGGAFLAATAATLESYNTGDFEKALVQYESALTILAGYCARVGVIAGAPVAKPAKGPVTRRTYLPGPFQLM